MHLYVVDDIASALLGAFFLGVSFKTKTFYYSRGRNNPAPRWYGRAISLIVGSGVLLASLWDLLDRTGH